MLNRPHSDYWPIRPFAVTSQVHLYYFDDNQSLYNKKRACLLVYNHNNSFAITMANTLPTETSVVDSSEQAKRYETLSITHVRSLNTRCFGVNKGFKVIKYLGVNR